MKSANRAARVAEQPLLVGLRPLLLPSKLDDLPQKVNIDILYCDHEGGQRMISRFGMMPRDDGSWIAAAGRHSNVDRADPR